MVRNEWRSTNLKTSSYFNHLYFIISLRMSDEIQSRIVMTNGAAKKICFHQQIGLNLREKKTSNVLHLEHSFS